MRYVGLYFVIMGLCVSFGASAVTGSSPSAVTPLDTVSPALQSVTAVGEKNLSATFSEPMLASGVTAPGSYAVSGLGAGTLVPSPSSVSGGSATMSLDWSTGEMRTDMELTLTASGVQDAVGNPINPAANSASCNGLGVAPVFSELTVMLPQASAGETVTIYFSTSEMLQAYPEVTVNGHPATAPFGKANGYVFNYEVQEDDPLGMALIEVSGADLAGNVGTLSNDDLLEIVKAGAGMPLWGWPWAAALLLALGLVFIREKMGLFPPRTSKGPNGSLHRDTLSGQQKTNPARGGDCPAFFGRVCQARKKFGTASVAVESLVHWLKHLRAPEAVPFFALLLACSLGFAQTPTVSNVTMTQSPTVTSTQVDIYYDLVAPNGPCDIAVTLSKDGGADGYSHPVTSITGDLANVTTGTGKHLFWDLRADYPEEYLPNARILVTANDGAEPVQYFRDDDGDTYGQDGDSVWAIGPAAPYTATWGTDCDDTDPDINPGMTEVCCNGKDDDCDGETDNADVCTFTLTYLAGPGGSISGTTPQDLYNCATGSEVTAMPDTGYHFVQWSDGVLTAARTDGNLTADLTVTANFAINTYTLTYLAGTGGSISGTTPQTVNHGACGTAVSAVADSGYFFYQWSDGVLTGARTDTNVTADITVTASFVSVNVTSFAINSGAATTTYPVVTLNNTCAGAPTQYMASESFDFSGASWLAYGTAPSFTLSTGTGGTKTVYFKVKNASGESSVVSDTIDLGERTILLPGSVPLVLRWIPSGSYQMGRYPGEMDSFDWEDPQHRDSLGCDGLCTDCAAGTLPGNRTDYMWYCGNNGASGTPTYGTKPVGGKTANAFGLYDMSGNVFEWCEDDYHASYTGAPADGSAWIDSPRVPARMIRGGRWSFNARYCRSAFRGYYTPDYRNYYFGFRLATVQ